MEPYQQALHQDWLQDMVAFLRAADPLHLIGAATEGFFVEDRRTLLHWHNPGGMRRCCCCCCCSASCSCKSWCCNPGTLSLVRHHAYLCQE
jgi:hypothetical protein